MTSFARFILVGVTNTLLTGALFFALSYFLPSWLAYSVAFGCGIVFASYATPSLAFRVTVPIARRVAFAIWYVSVYLLGLVAIQLLFSVLHAGRLEVTILTVAMTGMLGFAGARTIFAGLEDGPEG